MSNYSSIILCWAGIDPLVTNHQTRLNSIIKAADVYGLSAEIVSDEDTCEIVCLGLCNHFHQDDVRKIVAALQQHPWEYPEDVQLLSKDEDDVQYHDRIKYTGDNFWSVL